MQNYIKMLKERRIKITAQRLETFTVLKANNHLTAEEVFRRVRKKFPTLSFATVYAIINLFKSKGLIKELRIVRDKACFDGVLDLHHHLYCRRCRKIFDLYIPVCPSLAKKEVEGNLIEGVEGNFYGVCKGCRKT